MPERSDWQELAEELGERSDAISKLQRALRAIDVPELSAAELHDATKAAKKLADVEGVDPALMERCRAVATRLESEVESIRTSLRRELTARLAARAEGEGVPVRKLADEPLTLLLGSITFEVDVQRGEADVCFGREVIETVAADVDVLWDARLNAMARLKDETVDSAVFHDALRSAWRVVCDLRGLQADARVDLVDLALPTALQLSDPDGWRKRGGDELTAVPRYLMAFQLWKLRRDNLLDSDGWRLELGAATGGSTKSRRNVLFVPSSPEDGQWYLSARFVRG